MYSTECHPGSWGINCLNKCRCKNKGQCDPVTGECICADGWYGRECEEGKSYLSLSIVFDKYNLLNNTWFVQ